MYGGGPWGMMGGGWFGGIGMMIIGFLGFVLLVVGIIYIIRWILPQTNNQQQKYIDSDNSLGILKKRYANGEIDKQTFENMKKDLGY
ncbi:MAG: SHOCT domain-containing protein [Epsilonproteobacteria bacterium]|nr:SHOCT domain-containing protein [Campylobacterota bacterium]